jgi:hypothetical protein
MSKMTAVDFLEYRYKHNINLTEGDFIQAKQMEKEQIEESCNAGLSGIPRSAKQYYNDTYGG